tara:strand:+ start:2803 stop:6510 length:3708 start_codon:yes stop_codon:yes gene_type:complete
MSIYDVGVENLPNVYIQDVKVVVEANEKILLTSVYLKDHLYKPSWSGENQILEDLRVRLLVVYDDGSNLGEYNAIVDSLNAGTASVLDYEDVSSNYTIASEEPNTFVGPKPDQALAIYRASFNISLPKNCSDITLYVCSYYDFGTTLKNDFFNYFAGPVASEKIMSAGERNQNSGYFYFPDTNEPYGGPVHYHEGVGYMEGSTHRDAPHPLLVFVDRKDPKIKLGESILDIPSIDKSALPSNMSTQINDNNIAHIETYTMTKKSSVQSLVHINPAAMILQATDSAAILRHLNPAEYQRLISQNFQILSLKIFRKHHNSSARNMESDPNELIIDVPVIGNSFPRSCCYVFDPNTETSAKYSFTNKSIINASRPQSQGDMLIVPGEIYKSDLEKSTSHKISEIQELGFMQDASIRTFLLEDMLYASSAPQISYVVSVSFRQTLDYYIKQVLNNLSVSINFLSSLISDCGRSANYNVAFGTFTEAYKSFVAAEIGIDYNPATKNVFLNAFLSNLDIYDVQPDPYIKLIGSAVDAHKLLYTSGSDQMIQSLVDSILPFTTTVETLRALYDDLMRIQQEIESIYGISSSNFANSNESNTGEVVTSLFVDNGDTFEIQPVDLGYNVFTNLEGSNIKFTKQQLRNRLSYEEKYYMNLKNNPEAPSIDSSVRDNFDYYKIDRLRYLTPLGIKIEDSLIDLTPSFTDINSSAIMFFRLRAMGFISDTTPNNSSGENAFSGKMTATDGSVLSITNENLDEEEDGLVIIPSTQYTNPLNGNTITIDGLKLGDDDDIWLPNSESDILLVSAFSTLQTVSPSWYLDYPPHHKAMMFDNWGMSGYDFFTNNRFRRIIAETAMNVMRMECITGFDNSSTSGLEILSSPTITALSDDLLNSNKPFFCFCEPHSPDIGFGYFKSTQADSARTEPVPVLNNLAYTVGQVEISRTDPLKITTNFTYNYRDLKEYYKSNIVLQDPNKTGVLSYLGSHPLDLSAAALLDIVPPNVVGIEASGKPVLAPRPSGYGVTNFPIDTRPTDANDRPVGTGIDRGLGVVGQGNTNAYRGQRNRQPGAMGSMPQPGSPVGAYGSGGARSTPTAPGSGRRSSLPNPRTTPSSRTAPSLPTGGNTDNAPTGRGITSMPGRSSSSVPRGNSNSPHNVPGTRSAKAPSRPPRPSGQRNSPPSSRGTPQSSPSGRSSGNVTGGNTTGGTSSQPTPSSPQSSPSSRSTGTPSRRSSGNVSGRNTGGGRY